MCSSDLPDSNQAPTNRETHEKSAELAVEFVATLVNHIALTNFGIITVAIADSQPTIASRIQSRSQSSGLLDRLAIAHCDEDDKIETALGMLEREFHRVENLLVVSTRSRDSHHARDPSNAPIVFWRSMNWLDVGAGNITKYFAPSE